MRLKKAIKKLVCAAAAILVAATGMSVTADNGSSRDYAGYGAVIYSDIGAYVNHYPIASYSCGGKTVVVAEDLRNYGFDVDWNGDARTLNILPNYTKEISGCGTVYSGAGRQGKVFTYTCDSDIKVYIGGIEISAYCIDGYMMVSLEDLANLLDSIEFTWDSSTRSAKLWISWCAITVWQPLPVEVTVNNYPTYSETTYSAGISEVEPYQGIFKMGDKYIAVSLYPGVVPGEVEIGVVAHVTKPELVTIDGYPVPQFELIGDQGFLYDEGNNTYSIMLNNIKYGIVFKNGGIVLNSYTGEGSDFDGEYLQVSNNGANMMPKDIWYNEAVASTNTVDTPPSSTVSHSGTYLGGDPGNYITNVYCCAGYDVNHDKSLLKQYMNNEITIAEIADFSQKNHSTINTADGLMIQKALDLIKSAYGVEITGTAKIYTKCVTTSSYGTSYGVTYDSERDVYYVSSSSADDILDGDDTNTSVKILKSNGEIVGIAN